MEVCRNCNGTKSTNMGHMKEKCKKCDGKGYVSKVETVAIPAVAKVSPTKKPKGSDKHGEKESRAENA